MLKHLTLSSGWMQKQQWMLHLYWLEVIRRYFFRFFYSPTPQTVQSWESGPGPVLWLRCAGAQSRPVPLPFHLRFDI